MKILVTGCAGFIGFHLSKKLIDNNITVVGVDNINNYYDINLKKSRLKILNNSKKFIFSKFDINNYKKLNNIFKKYQIKYVIHLAAQAGVRHSIKKPEDYFDSNISAFFNLMQCIKDKKIKHCIFASTSSVYGDTKNFPILESQNTDNPLTFYAASKKTNEIMAYSYSNIYKIPFTCVRLFTVYGPFGRPDMALFKFVKLIIEKKQLKLFNRGNHIRDFTYIDDVINSIFKLIKKPPKNNPKYNVFNISSNNPKTLNDFVNEIEKNLNFKAKKIKVGIQIGDVVKTNGSNKKISKYINFKPKNDIKLGIKNFIEWYTEFYGQ